MLLLDEMTAALPADLVERVLEVVRRRAESRPLGDLHLAPAARDLRALRPRDGAARRRDRRRRRHGAGRRGADRRADARRAGREGRARPRGRTRRRTHAGGARRRACACAISASGPSSRTSPSIFTPARCWASWRSRDRGRTSCSTCSPVVRPTRRRDRGGGQGGPLPPSGRRHRAGLVLVPGDRTEAFCMQRSVRENIALPFSARLGNWGPIDGAERGARSTRRSSGCRSTPAPRARCGACPAATSRR